MSELKIKLKFQPVLKLLIVNYFCTIFLGSLFSKDSGLPCSDVVASLTSFVGASLFSAPFVALSLVKKSVICFILFRRQGFDIKVKKYLTFSHFLIIKKLRYDISGRKVISNDSFSTYPYVFYLSSKVNNLSAEIMAYLRVIEC